MILDYLWSLAWIFGVNDNLNVGQIGQGIERGDNGSGQLAYELAGLLRSSDRKYDALRNDAALAKRLATFLNRDLAETLTRAAFWNWVSSGTKIRSTTPVGPLRCLAICISVRLPSGESCPR